ncbi:Mu-like prophage major head subunit gpT family protein [Budviciaceae bacterium CWB-B4]|uniref:Mu-like prophage major head subunit gpT family protein n=1 Tax=Limnobaculum xujianqingii TaxID=2738837 RepID=A0A9D7FSD5_9GAMM|nr:Mu-like prophage major head subunit gpT family protein [Limnobaculum xujianqingii]MBK5072570.1 Mu-like prophage major head subunit gpT family protein [Limnobaculum xujianqingii]MBK5175879.1 Mu-like prophage major head subunit gpT family protein [Limnobaculum xujianqingii]
MIVTPDSVRALSVTFNKSFQDGVKLADSTYKQVAMVVPSSAAANVYAWLGQFPQMKEWIGSRTLRDMAAQGYTIPNILYESTVPVARTDIEDDNVGVYSPIFQMQGQESEQYPNRHVFGLFKVGETKLCYDGQNFFDTDHPVYANVDGTGTATPVSNYFAGAGTDPAWYLMDTTKPLKPFIFQERIKPQLTNKLSDQTSDHVFMEDEFLYGIRARSAVGFGLWQLCVKSTKPLTPESYEEAYQALRNMKADGGDPLNVTPNLLVVPSNLLPAAKTIVEKQFLAGGENNSNYGLSKILDAAWLN